MIDIKVTSPRGNFSFTAPNGVTAVFGPSGSGKTTLVNMIAGLHRPDSGQIRINGQTLFDSKTRINIPTHKRNIGYVFQDARLFPHMNVARNLTYGGNHDHDQIIDLFGIAPLLKRKPATLSGGEQQRVALGRALMRKPDILLMDEPLAALDSQRKAEILPYFERLRDTLQIPIIYVSHAMSEVARLATTLIILDAGRVIAAGPMTDVLSQPNIVPLLGIRDAGAVINAKVAGRMLDDGLTELSFSGGRIKLPGNLGQIGQMVRLRIPAQDVILARTAPQGISALNILPVTITAIADGRGPGVAVGLQCGQTKLLARVTKRSARMMDLRIGMNIYAIIKATAVAPEDVG